MAARLRCAVIWAARHEARATVAALRIVVAVGMLRPGSGRWTTHRSHSLPTKCVHPRMLRQGACGDDVAVAWG